MCPGTARQPWLAYLLRMFGQARWYRAVAPPTVRGRAQRDHHAAHASPPGVAAPALLGVPRPGAAARPRRARHLCLLPPPRCRAGPVSGGLPRVSAASSRPLDLHTGTTCADDHHRFRPSGYALRPAFRPHDCSRPLDVRCRDCDARTLWPCGGHRESSCKACSARYRRRVRSVATSGMTAERAQRYMALATFTAPGRAEHRLPNGERCECTPPGGVDLAEWNSTHSRRWNHLRTLLRREYPDLQFMRGVEVQGRGALHDHAIVYSPAGALDLALVRRLAIRAGFGHSVDLAPCTPGSKRAAYYVSKYVTKACDSRDDVPWLGEVVDRQTGEVTVGLVPGRYRTWSCSREWGDTMRDVRAVGAAYARRVAAEAADRSLADALAALSGLVDAARAEGDARPAFTSSVP